jgi:hypothetical protein
LWMISAVSIVFYGPHITSVLLFWTWIFLPYLCSVISSLPVSPIYRAIQKEGNAFTCL